MPIKYRESTSGYLITDGLKNKKKIHIVIVDYVEIAIQDCHFFNLNLSIMLSVVYIFGIFS